MSRLLYVALLLALSQAEVVRHAEKIRDSYIIRYKSDMNALRAESLAGFLKTRSSVVDHLVNVRTITVKGPMTDTQLNALDSDPDVEFVEEDGPVYALELDTKAGGCSTYDDSSLPWGLDYMDSNRGDDRYNVDDTVASTNDPVYVYVADTGIDDSHPDFQGRVGHVYTAFSSYDDGNGHGTHCAGTIGGYYFGVAKRAFLANIRVLDDNGSGSYSGVIAGINAAVSDHNARKSRSGKGYAKSVLSMSLGGGKSTTVNSAVNDAVAAGVTTAVAAGNSNADANNYSPASASDVISVGATDVNMRLASFSNWGSAVDIHAPGVSVKSAWTSKSGRRRRRSPTARSDNPSANLPPPSQSPGSMLTRTISGTSMACPHVAGVIANYLLGYEGAPPSPAAISTWMLGIAKNGLLDLRGVRNTVNIFLQGKQC